MFKKYTLTFNTIKHLIKLNEKYFQRIEKYKKDLLELNDRKTQSFGCLLIPGSNNIIYDIMM